MTLTILLRQLTVILAICALVWSAGATPPELVGDWAGWAYGEGDFPFRLTAPNADQRPLFWTPVSKGLNLTPDEVERDGENWVFRGQTSKGTAFRLRGALADRALRGTGALGESFTFEFELLRSVQPLEAILGEQAPDFEGVFVSSSGAAVFLSTWFWGEVILDRDGCRRTLFPIGNDKFFIGPAMYDPSTMEALVEFERDASGAPDALTLSIGSVSDRFVRHELSETPIEFNHEEATLRGTLVMPPGEGPYPAVVLLGGSDWTTRDGMIETARRFAASGVAALAYDKRGTGESTGGLLEWFPLTAADAVAGARALRERSDILPDQIGYLGISRGGWTAPLSATMDADAAFMIAFVAPAVSPDAQERTRRLGLLRAEGVSEAQLDLARSYLDAQITYATTGAGWDTYLALRAEIETRGWLPALLGPDDPYDPDWAWARLNMLYDPIPTIERLDCPTLVLLGGADASVPPSQNEPLWRSALERSPTEDWAVEVIPEADHGFRIQKGDGPPPRIHDATGISPELWPLVTEWLDARTAQR